MEITPIQVEVERWLNSLLSLPADTLKSVFFEETVRRPLELLLRRISRGRRSGPRQLRRFSRGTSSPTQLQLLSSLSDTGSIHTVSTASTEEQPVAGVPNEPSSTESSHFCQPVENSAKSTEVERADSAEQRVSQKTIPMGVAPPPLPHTREVEKLSLWLGVERIDILSTYQAAANLIKLSSIRDVEEYTSVKLGPVRDEWRQWSDFVDKLEMEPSKALFYHRFGLMKFYEHHEQAKSRITSKKSKTGVGWDTKAQRLLCPTQLRSEIDKYHRRRSRGERLQMLCRICSPGLFLVASRDLERWVNKNTTARLFTAYCYLLERCFPFLKQAARAFEPVAHALAPYAWSSYRSGEQTWHDYQTPSTRAQIQTMLQRSSNELQLLLDGMNEWTTRELQLKDVSMQREIPAAIFVGLEEFVNSLPGIPDPLRPAAALRMICSRSDQGKPSSLEREVRIGPYVDLSSFTAPLTARTSVKLFQAGVPPLTFKQSIPFLYKGCWQVLLLCPQDETWVLLDPYANIDDDEIASLSNAVAPHSSSANSSFYRIATFVDHKPELERSLEIVVWILKEYLTHGNLTWWSDIESLSYMASFARSLAE